MNDKFELTLAVTLDCGSKEVAAVNESWSPAGPCLLQTILKIQSIVSYEKNVTMVRFQCQYVHAEQMQSNITLHYAPSHYTTAWLCRLGAPTCASVYDMKKHPACSLSAGL